MISLGFITFLILSLRVLTLKLINQNEGIYRLTKKYGHAMVKE